LYIERQKKSLVKEREVDMGHCRNFFLFFLLALPSVVHAQALPTASPGIRYQVGAAISLANPDYTTEHIKGYTVFGDVDLTPHFVAELEYHDVNIITPHDVGETSFLINVLYKYNKGKFHPYAKVGAGLGDLKFAEGYFATSSSSTHGMFALGGGLDYKITRKISVRAIDFEYQEWSFQPHGLTPWVGSIGAAYSF
jgi:hypothetical protein